MQDLVDTLRELEEELDALDDDFILDASGKEELGGGVQVGITVNLNNAHIQFEERTTSTSSGTATSGGSATRLIDTGADFVTDQIIRGDTVVNFTDRSLATVIDVISATELLTRPLVDGTSNQWTIGDVYKVWHVIQCNAEGGNLVAQDQGTPIPAVVPSTFTQVVRTSSSSATLQELEAIQYAAYGDGVSVDTTSTYSGTAYPIGTLQRPVNNFADALVISNTLGLKNIYINDSASLTAGDWSQKRFVCQGGDKILTIGGTAITDDCRFFNLDLQGTLGENVRCTDCIIDNATHGYGIFFRCRVLGIITLVGSGNVTYFDSVDLDPSTSANATFDFLAFTGGFAARSWQGGIAIRNKIAVGPVSVELLSGRLNVEASVTQGAIQVRGIGTLVNDSAVAVSSADLLQAVAPNVRAVKNLVGSIA